MKENELQPLRDLLKEYQGANDEVRRLGIMEREARQAIEQATDDDLAKESTQRKIADARLSLDLVASRRKKLTGPASDLRLRLKEQFLAVGNAWNAYVESVRQDRERQYTEATRPFYNGDERFMRGHLNLLRDKISPEYNASLWHRPSYGSPEEEDLARDAQLLLDQIVRVKKKLELK